MPDDDPIEDLQRAGATAGAAGARAVEAALRSRQQQPQQQQSAERHHQQPESPEQAANRAEQRRLTAEFENRLDSAKEWAQAERPDLLEMLSERHYAAESRQDHLSANKGLISSWEKATQPEPDGATTAVGYDSPEARAGRHDAMEAAGVPLEARQAAVTADKMNATDPAHAARSGAAQKTHRPRTARQPQRERSR